MKKGALAGQFRENWCTQILLPRWRGGRSPEWESLQIDKMRGGIGPFSLSIDEIA